MEKCTREDKGVLGMWALFLTVLCCFLFQDHIFEYLNINIVHTELNIYQS